MLKTGVMLTLCIKFTLPASSSANDDSRWKGSSPRDALRQSDSDYEVMASFSKSSLCEGTRKPVEIQADTVTTVC
jgi:hypothetical protein